MIKILVKKLSSKTVLPSYETKGSSGMDIFACIDRDIVMLPGETKIIPTGISVVIPNNYEIQTICRHLDLHVNLVHLI